MAGMVGTVPKINDLDSILKIQAAHVLQTGGPIDEQDHFLGLAHAAPDRLLSQHGAKVLQRTHTGNIGGGLVIAHRPALLITLMLSEGAPQVGRAGFGAAVRLLARPPLELFFAHGQAGGIRTDVEDWYGLGIGQRLERFSLLPLLGSGPDWLGQALNLAGG